MRSCSVGKSETTIELENRIYDKLRFTKRRTSLELKLNGSWCCDY
ncbi:MAG: hypothetical protein ACTS4Z_02485 [Candidatus Hodgkinia cicadicola]